MIGVCILPVYFGPVRHGGINVWYCVAAIAAVNACFHILGVFTLKKYSPGVVTGVLFYIPLFLYGSWWSLSTGSISPMNALFLLGVGVAYHVFADRGHKVAAKNGGRT